MPHFVKSGRGKGGQTAKSKVTIKLSKIHSTAYDEGLTAYEKGVFDTIYDQIADLGASDEVKIGSFLDERLHEIEDALLKKQNVEITAEDHPDVIRAFKSCMKHFDQAEKVGLKRLQHAIDRSAF